MLNNDEPNSDSLLSAMFERDLHQQVAFLPSYSSNIGLLKMIVGVVHNTIQMQPHTIAFYGVTSRMRFMFLLFPQVTRN